MSASTPASNAPSAARKTSARTKVNSPAPSGSARRKNQEADRAQQGEGGVGLEESDAMGPEQDTGRDQSDHSRNAQALEQNRRQQQDQHDQGKDCHRVVERHPSHRQ
jgi:hypothetical protein